MLRSTITLALLAVLAGAAHADEDLDALARESLATYNSTQALQQQMNEACKAQSDALSKVDQARYALRREAPSEGDLKRQEKRVADLEAQLQRERERLEMMKMRAQATPEEIAAKLKALEAQRAAAREALQRAQKPWRERIARMQGPVDAKSERFQQALAKLIRTSAKDTPVASGSVRARAGDAFFSADWRDESGKQLVWCHLRLRDKPPANARAEKLGGEHQIITQSNSQLWIWAGHFQIAFVPSDPSMRSKEKLKSLIQLLIDLDALAAIDASPGGAKTGAPQEK